MSDSLGTSLAPQNPPFVHLRLHTEFSVQDGLLRVKQAIELAKKFDQAALALTDLNNLFGFVKFYKEARKQGIKPICGCDVWVTNTKPAQRDQAHRLLLLVQNHTGYLQLNALLSRAYLENAWKGRPEIHPDWLDQDSTQGLIALSAGMQGEIGAAIMSGQDPDYLSKLSQSWRNKFSGRFFIELTRNTDHAALTNTYTDHAIALAARENLPVVATHPIQFATVDDYDAHEARVCIAAGEMLADTRRVRRFSPEQYFKSTQEMTALFADIPVALANSVAIAQSCNLNLTLGKSQLPNFPTPDNVTIEQHLANESQIGLDKRLEHLYPDPEHRQAQRARYEQRQEYELGVINKMGFPGYFLIVADFIAWAKSNDVPVGAGRGSGAGSLVAYALGITDLDPLAYDLLFERFLNPERVSMPDFDIDFCQDKRGEVIKYVKQKYGAAAVSQIATFGTLGAKAVIRDVGRVMDMSYNYCDGLSKLIPANPTDPWDLQRALKEEPQFKERYENEDDAKAIVDMSLALEGLTRNVGMHAGGVLIAPGKLTDFCPLYCQPGKPDDAVSQYDKDDVEAVGLVKFDFLGLKNLTTINYAVNDIKRMDPERANFSLLDIALDDPDVLAEFTKGNTVAIFQCEGSGARKLCMDMGADNFDDVIALMALNRPGPLNSGMVDDYINRKKEQSRTGVGRQEWYMLPQLADVLRPTYGVMVYQEQVMQVAQVVGGYTLGGADVLRRIMGKKKKEDLDAEKPKFLDGAKNNGVDPAIADRLFDLMAKFADYGFNKSHSAAYGLISYHTAWLKHYYPSAYMAAAMTLDAGNTDQLQVLVDDARAQGLAVLPPCVNQSVHRFIPIDTHTIRYGLGGLKGSGEGAAIAIEAERTQNGPYESLLDFCTRVDKRAVNRRSIEALIRSGAFDSIHTSRAKLMASVDAAMSAAETAAQAAGQNALFGLDEAPAFILPTLDSVHEWDLISRLREEKTALGYHLSGHLFDAYSATARALDTTPLAELKPKSIRSSKAGDKAKYQTVWVAGIVRAVRIQIGKKGKMAYITLDDRSAIVEIAVFADTYAKVFTHLSADSFLGVLVKPTPTENGGMRVSALDVVNEDGLWAKRCGHINLVLTPQADRLFLSTLKPFLGHEGASLSITVNQAGGSAELTLPNLYVQASASVIATLRTHPCVAHLSFSIGTPKTAYPQAEAFDNPSFDSQAIDEDAHNSHYTASYSDQDLPHYDAEYDYV